MGKVSVYVIDIKTPKSTGWKNYTLGKQATPLIWNEICVVLLMQA